MAGIITNNGEHATLPTNAAFFGVFYEDRGITYGKRKTIQVTTAYSPRAAVEGGTAAPQTVGISVPMYRRCAPHRYREYIVPLCSSPTNSVLYLWGGHRRAQNVSAEPTVHRKTPRVCRLRWLSYVPPVYDPVFVCGKTKSCRRSRWALAWTCRISSQRSIDDPVSGRLPTLKKKCDRIKSDIEPTESNTLDVFTLFTAVEKTMDQTHNHTRRTNSM